MTAPAHEKTWEFSVNNREVADGTTPVDNRDFYGNVKSMLYNIKEAMIGNGSYTDKDGAAIGGLTVPWLVDQSSDQVTADFTDNWGAPSDLRSTTRGSAIAHSWIALTMQQLAGQQMHVLWNHEGFSGNDGAVMDCYIAVDDAPFGGGTITARPSAGAAELILCEGNTSGLKHNFGAGQTIAHSGREFVWHFMQSSDGECCRILICHQGVPIAIWLFDTVKNPSAGWFTPFVAFMGQVADSNTTPVMKMTTFYDAANVGTLNGFVPFGAHLTSSSWKNTAQSRIYSHRNEVTKKYDWSQIGVSSGDSGFVGRHGILYDMFWGPVQPTGKQGGYYPDTGERQWIQFGDIVVPWNSTKVQLG